MIKLSRGVKEMKIQGEGTQSYLENSTPLSNFLFLQVEPIIFSWSTSIRIIIVDPLSTQQCKCLIPVSSFRLLLCVCVCLCMYPYVQVIPISCKFMEETRANNTLIRVLKGQPHP